MSNLSTKTVAMLAFALLTSASFAAETVVDLPSGVKGALHPRQRRHWPGRGDAARLRQFSR